MALFIYVFYRTDKTVINQLLLLVVPPGKFTASRTAVASALPLPAWMLYSLPEALWVFCAMLLSKNIFFTIGRFTINCAYIPMGFAILWELLQLTHVTKGYFDFTDLLLCATASVLALCFFRPPYAPTHLFKRFNVRSVLFFWIFGIVYLSHVV